MPAKSTNGKAVGEKYREKIQKKKELDALDAEDVVDLGKLFYSVNYSCMKSLRCRLHNSSVLISYF